LADSSALEVALEVLNHLLDHVSGLNEDLIGIGRTGIEGSFIGSVACEEVLVLRSGG
jgi:hypothetical protein